MGIPVNSCIQILLPSPAPRLAANPIRTLNNTIHLSACGADETTNLGRRVDWSTIWGRTWRPIRNVNGFLTHVDHFYIVLLRFHIRLRVLARQSYSPCW